MKEEKKKSAKAVFKKQIPLLKILRDLPPESQIILLHHLDSTACCNIKKCIKKVLAGTNLQESKKKNLRKNLLPYKNLMREIANTKPGHSTKNLLPQIGGAGLSLILSSALPLLIDIAKKKKWI